MKPKLTALLLSGTLLFAGCRPLPPIPPAPIPPIENPVIPVPSPEPEPIPNPVPNPEPTPQPEPEPIRNDLYATISLLEYQVGDNFNYTGKLQNATLLPLAFSNTGLELRLMKGDKLMNTTAISKEFYAKLLEYGYMEFIQADKQMTVKVSNVEIDINGKHYKVPHPIVISQSFPMPVYNFKEAGTYCMEAEVDYEFEGSNYTAKFKSGEFEVE